MHINRAFSWECISSGVFLVFVRKYISVLKTVPWLLFVTTFHFLQVEHVNNTLPINTTIWLDLTTLNKQGGLLWEEDGNLLKFETNIEITAQFMLRGCSYLAKLDLCLNSTPPQKAGMPQQQASIPHTHQTQTDKSSLSRVSRLYTVNRTVGLGRDRIFFGCIDKYYSSQPLA